MVSMSRRVPLSSFTNVILFMLEGLADPIAEEYVLRAAIHIGEKTMMIRRTVEILPQDCVHDYIIRLPAEERAHAILKVNNPYSCGHNLIQYMTITDLDRIHIDTPVHDADEPLRVTVATVPLSTACDVDAQYLELAREAIEAHALSQLALIPRTTFQDAALAQIQWQRYLDLLGQLKIDIKLKGRRGTLNYRTGKIG